MRRAERTASNAGAGAIGAYIGARMSQAGFDVTLFARGPHLRAMQENGVQVKSAEGDFVLPLAIGEWLNVNALHRCRPLKIDCTFPRIGVIFQEESLKQLSTEPNPP